MERNVINSPSQLGNHLLGHSGRGYAPRMRARGQNGQLQTQSGKWTLRYYADSPNGRIRKRHCLGEITRLTKAEAWKEARKFLVGQDALAIHPNKQVSLGQFWDDVFLPDYVSSCKASGKKHYLYVYSHMVSLSRLGLETIATEHVQRLCKAKLESGLSSQTVVHIKNGLSAIVNFAIERGYYKDRNPCVAVKMPEMVKTKESRALTFEQATKLVQGLERFKSPVAVMALMSITTSMNVSEMLGLTWGKVNLETDKNKLCGTIVIPSCSMLVSEQNYRGTVGSVKSSNRERIVPIGEELVKRLKEWKEKKAELLQHLDSMAVFTTRSGKIQLERNLLDDIKVIGATIDCPWASWHTFRHTYNTLASQNGIGIVDRMAGSGHGSMRISLLYSHSEIERRRKGIEEIERNIINRTSLAT